MPGTGRTIVTGGTVVLEHGLVEADVVIEGERIVGLVAGGSATVSENDQLIDANGLLVFPGMIDAHTHFWEPADELLEGFASGGAGAVAGGVTTVVEMPQADPTTILGDEFIEKRQLVHTHAIADMALWGGVIGAPTQSSSDLEAMAAEGAVAFMSTMASRSRSFPEVNDAQLHDAMRVIADLGLPYGIHAENDDLVEAGLVRLQAAQRTDPLAHAESRPPLVETVAVATVLQLAEATGCEVYITHCASPVAMDLVVEARERGVNVRLETCPQYLVMDTSQLEELAGFARCVPPLRPPELVEMMWDFVLEEAVDVIASDHWAFTTESKEVGAANIFDAPNGFPGVQTLFPLMYDAAVAQRGMSPDALVRLMAANPARIFGLYPRKGTIMVGSDADLVLFDPQATWTITNSDLRHRQQWTPYAGRTLKGRVQRTIRRGETVFDVTKSGMDQVPAAPGSGRFLPRGYGEGTA